MENNEKLQKEQALQGLTGGNFSEILLLLFVVPASVYFYRSIHNFFKRNHLIQLVTSIGTVILPLILAMSYLEHFVLSYCLITFSLSFLVTTYVFPHNSQPTTSLEIGSSDEDVDQMNSKLKPFLSNYRASMMLATCIAILGVDFNLFFPVRFAKCEEYGISLMDVGVGGFIFSSGLVSTKTRSSVTTNDLQSENVDINFLKNNSGSKSCLPDKNVTPRPSWLRNMTNTVKLIIPLLILGVGRFIIIKAIGYQEHVTEYGTHWNFFMTLALIALLVAALDIPLSFTAVGGIMIISVYEYALTSLGVAEFIINAERGNQFFTQNREGILSCFGFLSIYLISQYIGSILVSQRNRQSWKSLAFKLLLAGIALWIAAIGLDQIWGIAPSRRMANSSYVLYTLSCNLVIIAAFLFVDLISNSKTPNVLLDSVATKRNAQLVVFTIANLLTGATNVFVGTFNRPPLAAFIIMTTYMTIVSLIAIYWTNVLSFILSFVGAYQSETRLSSKLQTKSKKSKDS